jgi:hypothetical protein
MFSNLKDKINISFIFQSHLDNLFLFLEHKQRLCLKTCSFKARVVLDLSVSSWVFQHAVVLGVDVEKLVYSLPSDLICLVKPARGFSPLIHRSRDHRDSQALSPRQGKGPPSLERVDNLYKVKCIVERFM